MYQSTCCERNFFPDLYKYPNLKLEDIGPFAHHLYLCEAWDEFYVDEKTVIFFLNNCPNIQNLVLQLNLSKGRDLIQHIQSMPNLRKLSTSLRLPQLSKNTLLSSNITKLTHLHLMEKPDSTWAVTFLPEVVNLTHFASDNSHEWIDSEVQDVLRACPQLLALVLFEQEMYTAHMGILSMHEEDPRVVLFAGEFFPDPDEPFMWADGLRDGYDFWDLADLFVTAWRGMCLHFTGSSLSFHLICPLYSKCAAPTDGYFNTRSLQQYSSEAIRFDFDWEANLNEKGKGWFETIRFEKFPFVSFLGYYR